MTTLPLETEKPKNPNNYFTKETEDAIVAFQNEPDIEKKKKIFVVRCSSCLP